MKLLLSKREVIFEFLSKMPMISERILAIIRSRLLKILAKALPYIYLQLDKNLCVYFPSDSFGALEENLLIGHNIYFDIPSIAEADTIIDLGAHAGVLPSMLYCIQSLEQEL